MSLEREENLREKLPGLAATVLLAAGAVYLLVRSEGGQDPVSSDQDPSTSSETPFIVRKSTPLPTPIPVITDCEFDENRWQYVPLLEGKVNDLGIPTPVCLEFPPGDLYPILS